MTQVLDDGINTYLYGNGRIAQAGSATEYFLGDALGSGRQLADPAGAVTLTQSYAPYGETISSVGSGYSAYQFTGEMRDSYIKLIYLRSRYYAPETGRFLTKDSWQGDYNRPLSLNQWNYVEGNPVMYSDPTGHIKKGNEAKEARELVEKLRNQYNVHIEKDWGYQLIAISPPPTLPGELPGDIQIGCECKIRSISSTDSGACRPLIPEHAVH